MKRFKSRKSVLALVAVLVVAIASVGAYAYWTSNGTGQGTANVGTDAGVTIAPVTFDDTLYPGSNTVVNFTINNTSANTAVNVDKVVQDGPVTGLPVGCLASDFSFADVNLSNVQIPASGTYSNTGTLAMANTLLNQDACKLANPVLHLKIDNTGIGGS